MKKIRKSSDFIAGFLKIGTNGKGEVVINLDKDRTGHIIFSPAQASALAMVLRRKANEAVEELETKQPHEGAGEG